MRGLLEFFSIFDWITPSVGFIEDLIYDPTPLQSNSWTFFVPYDEALSGGWNAFDIEGMLRQYGVKTWGSQITNGNLFFSVKLEQAQWAEYLLLRNSIPLLERSLAPPKPKQKKKKSSVRRRPKKKRGYGPFSFLDDFFNELF